TELYAGDTPDTLHARYGMYNAVWKSGRAEEAVAGFESLLPDVARVFGETHWMEAATRRALAMALIDAGRAPEALPHAEQAHQSLLEILGPDHERTINARTTVERARAETQLADPGC